MAKRKSKIGWSRLADLDLDSAHSYSHERSPEAARRFAQDVLDAIEQLRRHPYSGPVANDILPEGRYRHLPVGRYPHHLQDRRWGDRLAPYLGHAA